ncbi:molybdopterin-dependent oxidoreductase [Deferribacteres bacterium DY0037]
MNFFCSKDCPDLCGVKATVTSGGYKFSGVQEKWSPTGFVCSKFKVFAEREINNGLTSWQIIDNVKTEYPDNDTAIAKMAEFLNEFKDKKILYMRGSGSLAYNMCYWDVLFSQFPNCAGTTGGPCDETGGDAHEEDFGVLLNPPASNLEKARTIILYGKNAAVSSQHLYAYLKDMKKKGRKIIYIDPVKAKTSKIADRYIAINPSCDGILACALLCAMGFESGHDINSLISKTGVSSADFELLLSEISTGQCAHIQGFGIQRHANGMNAYQWINRLAVKTGSEDMLYYSHSSKRLWTKQKTTFKNCIHVDKIAESLADGDFDLFVNAAANPAMTYPDTNLWTRGLSRTKTLVIDTNNTETSAHADFFLKVGGMFSQADFMGSYFFPHSYTRKKLTDETSDTEAVVKLAARLGLEIEVKAEAEVPRKEQENRKYKTEELPLVMPEEGEGFKLLTSSHHSYLNSQILPGMEKGRQVVFINEKDAEELGIKTGDDVRISGKTGGYKAEAVVTEGIVRQTIMSWKSIPMKDGYVNSAIGNKLTDSGNGLVLYGQYVEVKKI